MDTKWGKNLQKAGAVLKSLSIIALWLWKVLLLEEAGWSVHRNPLNYFCNFCVHLKVFESRHLKKSEKWFQEEEQTNSAEKTIEKRAWGWGFNVAMWHSWTSVFRVGSWSKISKSVFLREKGKRGCQHSEQGRFFGGFYSSRYQRNTVVGRGVNGARKAS